MNKVKTAAALIGLLLLTAAVILAPLLFGLNSSGESRTHSWSFSYEEKPITSKLVIDGMVTGDIPTNYVDTNGMLAEDFPINYADTDGLLQTYSEDISEIKAMGRDVMEHCFPSQIEALLAAGQSIDAVLKQGTAYRKNVLCTVESRPVVLEFMYLSLYGERDCVLYMVFEKKSRTLFSLRLDPPGLTIENEDTGSQSSLLTAAFQQYCEELGLEDKYNIEKSIWSLLL